MSTDLFFDGNAVAGELRNVFCNDVTAAEGECAACGKIAPLAEGRVYAFAPGIVIRCSACGQPLLRLVNADSRLWLDIRGLVYLQFRSL
ncbi:MAG TPA: DUF6510 family protein [Candidatus Cybelea sp.]|jgi:hypothetical protein|nr:DUF6510 family protein [Candidatus Cybelea sp.]